MFRARLNLIFLQRLVALTCVALAPILVSAQAIEDWPTTIPTNAYSQTFDTPFVCGSDAATFSCEDVQQRKDIQIYVWRENGYIWLSWQKGLLTYNLTPTQTSTAAPKICEGNYFIFTGEGSKSISLRNINGSERQCSTLQEEWEILQLQPDQPVDLNEAFTLNNNNPNNSQVINVPAIENYSDENYLIFIDETDSSFLLSTSDKTILITSDANYKTLFDSALESGSVPAFFMSSPPPTGIEIGGADYVDQISNMSFIVDSQTNSNKLKVTMRHTSIGKLVRSYFSSYGKFSMTIREDKLFYDLWGASIFKKSQGDIVELLALADNNPIGLCRIVAASAELEDGGHTFVGSPTSTLSQALENEGVSCQGDTISIGDSTKYAEYIASSGILILSKLEVPNPFSKIYYDAEFLVYQNAGLVEMSVVAAAETTAPAESVSSPPSFDSSSSTLKVPELTVDNYGYYLEFSYLSETNTFRLTKAEIVRLLGTLQ